MIAHPTAETRAASAQRRSLTLVAAAALTVDEVLARLGSTRAGLSPADTAERLATVGPNALRSHGARPLAVLARQLRNPLLVLLVAAASLPWASARAR